MTTRVGQNVPPPQALPQAPAASAPLPPGASPAIQPGADAPLPTDVGGQSGSKASAPAGTAARASTAAPASSAEGTRRPTVTVGTDEVVRGGGERLTSDAPVSGAAFSDYSLPESEGRVSGDMHAEIDGNTDGLVNGVTDVLKSLFGGGSEGADWIRSRGDHLAANPQDGVLTSTYGAAISEHFPDAFAQSIQTSPLRAQLVERFGEGATKIIDSAQTVAADAILGKGLLGQDISLPKLVANVTAVMGGDAAKAETAVAMRMSDIGMRPRIGGAFSVCGPDGKIDPKKLGEIIAEKGPGALEASLEYFIGLCGRLVKGDAGKDMQHLGNMLTALKDEKKTLIREIIAKEGSILGIQVSQSEAAKAAKAAQDCAHAWSLAGSIIALVVVIIIAIVVTVFSCGSAGPAAVAAVTGTTVAAVTAAGVTASTFAVTIAAVFGITSIAVASALAASVVIAAILVAIIAFVMAIPALMETVAICVEAAGDPGTASKIREDAEKFQADLFSSGIGWVLIVAQLVCSLYMLVIMLPLGAANAANIGATIAQTSGTIAGAAVETTVNATQAILNIMNLINALSMVLTGVSGIAAGVITMNAAKFNLQLDLLRARLAEVELEIKELMHRVEEKRVDEQELKDDIQERQDAEQRMMESLNKCAETYKQILSETQILN